jgi:thiol-disulfide isomerase/thioredoxin/YHS domain-containing protein
MWPKRLVFWAAWTGMIALGPAQLPVAAAGDELKWEENLETAQSLARKSHRLVLMHFGGPWCPPCQRMEQEVFSKPGFGSEMTKHYVAVKIDPQRDPATAKKFGVQKVPSDVITTASGQLVYIFSPSPNTAADYVRSINGVAVESGLTADLIAGNPGAEKPPTPPAAAAPDAAPSHTATPTAAPALSQSDPAVNAAIAGKRTRQDTTDHEPRKTPHHGRDTSDLAPRDSSLASQDSLPSKPRSGRSSSMRQTATVRGADAPAAAESPSRSASQKMPTALDGFCPVTLLTRHKWQPGDRRWGAYHRGHLYLFAGEAEQKMFLAAPDDYTPAYNGLDPVLALDHDQKVAGKREFGAFYHSRVYLFSGDETFHQFERNPPRYTSETRQARRPAPGPSGTSTAHYPSRSR